MVGWVLNTVFSSPDQHNGGSFVLVGIESVNYYGVDPELEGIQAACLDSVILVDEPLHIENNTVDTIAGQEKVVNHLRI